MLEVLHQPAGDRDRLAAVVSELSEREVRSNSTVPTTRSTRRIDSDSDGCEMPSRLAAALKVAASAAAMRISICRSVKFIVLSYEFIISQYFT